MRTWIRLAAVAAALAAAGLGQAQDKDKEGKALTARQFVDRAAAAGMDEVALGKVGQERAQSAEVKRFAARMVADHSKANDELKDVAGKLKLDLPAGGKKKDHAADLPSGPGFDRAYMDHMVKDHEAAARLFDRASRELTEEPLKAFAAKTLPTIREHLRDARRIQTGLAEAADRNPDPKEKADGKGDRKGDEKADRKGDRFPGSIGMVVRAEGGRLRVSRLAPGSPADRAGVRAGDELVQVGGYRAGTRQGLDDLRGVVEEVATRQPGEKVKLTVRRGGKEESVEATVGKRSDWFPGVPPVPAAGPGMRPGMPGPGYGPGPGGPRPPDGRQADLERRLERLQAEVDALRNELRRK